jgi:hypothetical protein
MHAYADTFSVKYVLEDFDKLTSYDAIDRVSLGLGKRC